MTDIMSYRHIFYNPGEERYSSLLQSAARDPHQPTVCAVHSHRCSADTRRICTYERHLEDDDDEIKLVIQPKRLFSGNVIFGDYERDEVECRVSIDDIAAGTECEPAILLMPIADVLLHPEYKHFGAKYSNATKMTQNRMTCTTGCGFHSGAPTLVHEHTGHWSIVALSHGGSPCPDPLRVRRPPAPPHHIMIHPYVPWITAAITGKAVGAFAKDDPFGFIMPRASIYDFIAHGWVGHWWMGGLRCYDRGEAAEDLFKFYHEIFQINPVTETFLTYYLEARFSFLLIFLT
ncbi:hypothetical protein HF086_011054 [Spodoptera exigua]|uniref:Uncharacterized protein n=1 Tax=Spodoptera exigua TaxID=7107 RepID=A0A922SDJ6_SPOEX|nr:hypothetical protein HF086_011054 [Spodoptera exigua]